MKASFRTMLLKKTGEAYIITQDARRRRNIITGIIEVKKLIHQPVTVYTAKSFGCNLFVREK